MGAKGTPKTGGRIKGTTNKVTSDMRQWLRMLIDDNRNKFEKDLAEVEPPQRLAILEKLMQYCIPKMQSIDATIQIAEEYNQLERLLKTAPDEAVSAIAAKVVALRELSNNTKKVKK